MDQMITPPHLFAMTGQSREANGLQRQLYGVSLDDIYSYNSYAPHLYAAAARRSKSPYSSEFLQHVINLYDVTTSDSLGNVSLHSNAIDLWNKKKAEEVKAAEAFFESHYEDVIANTTALYSNSRIYDEQLEALKALKVSDRRWDRSVRDIIQDPIEVSPVNRERHYLQRKWCGYSDFDLDNPAAYIHWTTIQTILYLISDKSMSMPSNFDTEEEFAEFGLKKVVELYTSGFSINPSSSGNFASFYKEMPDLLFNLWD